jgi:xanthine dehydrogenase accessory factor
VPARGALPGAGSRFVEVVGRKRRPLYLFGAGHVGQAIARHAANLPFRLAWFDTRADFAAIDGVSLVADDSLEPCLADAPADAAVVILTHDHGLDYRLTLAALQCPPFAYVGLIGSHTKRKRFMARLMRHGVSPDDCVRLHCPIGLPEVPGKEPDVIAIATLAQLLALP